MRLIVNGFQFRLEVRVTGMEGEANHATGLSLTQCERREVCGLNVAQRQHLIQRGHGMLAALPIGQQPLQIVECDLATRGIAVVSRSVCRVSCPAQLFRQQQRPLAIRMEIVDQVVTGWLADGVESISGSRESSGQPLAPLAELLQLLTQLLKTARRVHVCSIRCV